jgi:ABC-type sugar transport system permease subunit
MSTVTRQATLAGPPAPRRKPRRRRLGRTPWFDWMVAPVLLVLIVVIGYPFVDAIVLSTQKYNVISGLPAHGVGLKNFDQLFSTDGVFWGAVRNTAIYTFGTVIVAGLLGMALALLAENLSGRWRVVRMALLTPWAVPIIVVAFLFRYMFQDQGGVVNAGLNSLGIVHHDIGWLTSGHWALFTVVLTNVWTQIPFFFLVFSAALAAIPNEVLEAARVDRSRGLATVVHIKLPFLRSAFLISSLIMVVNNFNDFGKIWAMTEGGPAYSTTTLVVYVYRLAFDSFNLGYASAVGVVWLAFLLVFAVLYVRALQREEPA